jgi:hypothetical protein
MIASRLLLTVLLCGAALPAAAQTQTQQPYPAEDKPYDEIIRFDGVLNARSGPLAGARVAVRHFQIRNSSRVEIPHAGFLIVQVRAGEVFVTAGGGERREYNPDQFFTVAPGERLLVETGDDSAVLHTVDTADLRR